MIPALSPGDAAAEANPELMKAIERVIDLGLIGKPAEYAEAYADLLDQISKLDTDKARKLAGTDFAQRMREAKHDSDRVAEVIDAFIKFSEEELRS